MPRGKRQSNRPAAGGIKRNDYHRRNRRANPGRHITSSGVNADSSFLRILNTPISVPAYDRDVLIDEAFRYMAQRNGSTDKAVKFKGKADYVCATYLRHRHSPYESLLGSRKWKNQNRDTYLLIFKRVMDAISASNSWLADTCSHQYEEKSGAAFSLRKHVRIVKGGGLTSQHVRELNQREEAQYAIAEPYDEDNELRIFHDAVSSLMSTRFLYLPPFLKYSEIRQRRFGGQLDMNDNWWEWEQELDFVSWRGRLNDRKRDMYA